MARKKVSQTTEELEKIQEDSVKTEYWIVIFVLSSFALNQITGLIFGRDPINILSFLIIPLIGSFVSKGKIRTAARLSMLPGLIILFLYYVIRPLLL